MAGINWGSSLARGMQIAYFPGRGFAHSIVGCDPTVVGAIGRGVTSKFTGPVIDTASGKYLSFDCPAPAQGQPWSVAFRAKVGTLAAGDAMWSWSTSVLDASPWYLLYSPVSTLKFLSDLSATAAIDAVEGDIRSFVVTSDGTNIRFYVDGVLLDTKSWSQTLTPDTMYLGIGYFSASENAVYDYLVFAHQAYNAAQVRALHQNPYQLLKPIRRWIPVAAAAAGGDQVVTYADEFGANDDLLATAATFAAITAAAGSTDDQSALGAGISAVSAGAGSSDSDSAQAAGFAGVAGNAGSDDFTEAQAAGFSDVSEEAGPSDSSSGLAAGFATLGQGLVSDDSATTVVANAGALSVEAGSSEGSQASAAGFSDLDQAAGSSDALSAFAATFASFVDDVANTDGMAGVTVTGQVVSMTEGAGPGDAGYFASAAGFATLDSVAGPGEQLFAAAATFAILDDTVAHAELWSAIRSGTAVVMEDAAFGANDAYNVTFRGVAAIDESAAAAAVAEALSAAFANLDVGVIQVDVLATSLQASDSISEGTGSASQFNIAISSQAGAIVFGSITIQPYLGGAKIKLN